MRERRTPARGDREHQAAGSKTFKTFDAAEIELARLKQHVREFPPIPENIPSKLKGLHAWVNWRYEIRESKKGEYAITKPLYRPSGGHAKSNNPGTWSSFDDVLQALQADELGFDGFGIALSNDLTGVDLDHQRDFATREISLEAREIIDVINSYTEDSPSGDGLRIICFGKLPPGRRKKADIEMYDTDVNPTTGLIDRGRYLTITGHHLDGTPTDIRERAGELARIHARVFGATKPADTLANGLAANSGEPLAANIDDAGRLEAARANLGERFFVLYDKGDWKGRYPSQSEADLALCGMLRDVCGRDPARIDRLFRRSGLMRQKWDERHGNRTYGEITIAKALGDSSRKPPAKASNPKAADIATKILTRDHFAQDAGREVYVFSGGVYEPEADEHIRRRVKALVPGRFWSSHLANEVIEYIRVDAPHLWFRPPLETLNVLNGLLDIKTRQLREHSPSFLSPIQIPVKFDPSASCPAWEKQIAATFPSDAVEAFVAFQIVAWLMLPIVSIQKAILLLGEGGTGKSTFLTALGAFLGRSNASALDLQKLENDRFARARLLGKLVNICADLPATHLATTSVFKQLTGFDPIVGEHKFENSFEFEPYARLIFAANQPPRSADATGAFFDRWLVFEFRSKFRGTDVELNRMILNAQLSDPGELSGVLNRALDALPKVLSHGILTTPSMRRASEEFRRATDPLAVWLDSHTIEAPNSFVPKDSLYSLYAAYAADQNLACPIKSAFGSALKEHRPNIRPVQRTVAGKERVHCYLGIGLHSDAWDSRDASGAS